MANKAKTSPYGLRAGHPNEFRRTIKGKKPYQLVFHPGEPIDLTQAELDGLRRELECGLIVPWDAVQADHRSRKRPLRKSAPGSDDATDDSDACEVVDHDLTLDDEE